MYEIYFNTGDNRLYNLSFIDNALLADEAWGCLVIIIGSVFLVARA